MSKLRNNTKGRNATANEIAKKIILDKLEIAFYFCDNNNYQDKYSQEFIDEIFRHMQKHIDSMHTRFNLDDIEMY